MNDDRKVERESIFVSFANILPDKYVTCVGKNKYYLTHSGYIRHLFSFSTVFVQFQTYLIIHLSMIVNTLQQSDIIKKM